MKELKKYLKNPVDFDLGVALMKRYFPSHFLLNQLEKGYTFSGERKMIKVLSSIDNDSTLEKKEPLIASTKTIEVNYQEVKSNNKEKVLAVVNDLKKEKSRLFSEASVSHVELRTSVLTTPQRQIRCKNIVENFNRLSEVWDALDYFERYGVLPNQYAFQSNYEKAVEDSKRINNLRTYISKLKKEIPLLKKAVVIEEKKNKLLEFTLELNHLLNGY